MARLGKKLRNRTDAEPGGLWHQPALMNLLADLLIVLALTVLAWSAWTALQRLPVFPLRELVLTTSPRQVAVGQIEHAARSAVVGNFFTVDLDAVRAVFEKLPWVRKVSLRRQWPGGLALAIEEHEAVARWLQPNGEAGLVNRRGEVFVAELPDDALPLPRLTGPAGSAPELLVRHAEFAGALAGSGRQVGAVTLSPRRAWQLKTDDGVTIDLGRDQGRHPLGERLQRFTAHYDALQGRVGKARVADMRYPNGFVLRGSEHAARQAPAATVGRKS